MSMDTINTRFWHEQYDKLHYSNPSKQAIDYAYKAMRKSLDSNGFVCANDDRAEMLVAAITQYVFTSRDK